MVSNVSLTMNNFRKAWGYTKQVLEVSPELMFGTASESVGEALRTTKGGLFAKAQEGWKVLKEAGKGNFFESFFGNFKTFIPSIKWNIKKGAYLAKKAGESTFKGGVKGFFKGLGKKMPFIGALSMMLFELPNIFTATKEKGIFQGAAEVVKAGARLTGGGLGAAIGSAVIPIPFVGSMAGWIAGEWLAGKIVGKSYSVQKAENEEKYKQNQELNQQQETIADSQQQGGYANPFWLNQTQNAQGQNPVNATPQIPYNPPMQGINTQLNTGMYNPYNVQNNPYANDIMMQQMPFNQIA